MDKTYLGSGMAFPIQVNPATGRIVVSSEEKSVKESIYLILMTGKTERLARPNFGSRLGSYPFMDMGYTRVNMVIRELRETILSQEPRISAVDINVEDQTRQGRIIFNIDYVIAANHTRDSLVFPFYLETGVTDTDIEDEIADLQDEDYDQDDTDREEE